MMKNRVVKYLVLLPITATGTKDELPFNTQIGNYVVKHVSINALKTVFIFPEYFKDFHSTISDASFYLRVWLENFQELKKISTIRSAVEQAFPNFQKMKMNEIKDNVISNYDVVNDEITALILNANKIIAPKQTQHYYHCLSSLYLEICIQCAFSNIDISVSDGSKDLAKVHVKK